MKVTIFTKNGCGYCTAAKQWMRERGIAYQEQPLNETERRKALYEDLSRRFKKNVFQVPQIVVNDGGLETYIGGYTDLVESDLAKRAMDFRNLDF